MLQSCLMNEIIQVNLRLFFGVVCFVLACRVVWVRVSPRRVVWWWRPGDHCGAAPYLDDIDLLRANTRFPAADTDVCSIILGNTASFRQTVKS